MRDTSDMKKLYRSRDNKIVSGVLGGIGEYLDVDPTIVRFIFLFIFFVTALVPAILFYFTSLLIVPEHPQAVVRDV
jgi:phage shock protein C